ncbi:ribosomal protein S5 domain 2-type protein [Stachybotrys elegans]|uniref:Phosphomevalonate kinase n=1 Tax=Stachybotrys elegans TaxID=80388 RepID=A0A8K0T0Y2_9HYPO|nr:ribosomal protein S5 domain 2-type protein [Stachybotrys elegans]
MSSQAKSTVACSAPGKVLVAGGYLVLDRGYTGTVFGLSARINVITGPIQTSPGVQLTEIVVESPQFIDAQWRYGYHLAPEDGGIKVTQLQVGDKISRNPFVETTLSYTLTYINQLASSTSKHSLSSAQLKIIADNDYYSRPDSIQERGRFANFNQPLSAANKTGLGSSAALVTSLTASLLVHYLPTELFDITSDKGKRTLHNLAQAAHCAAQGKVGSGFDVAAAVFGSSRYRRFSPSVLASTGEPGSPGFSTRLAKVVDDQSVWDVEVNKEEVSMPKGVVLHMCDVTCGSESVGMAKKVLAWKAADTDISTKLWDDLQSRNDALASTLREGKLDELPQKINSVRELIRKMGELSDVPIEPPSQTELLDAVSAVEGVYGGVVPGAGGYDAAAILMKDDAETKRRVEEFLARWSQEKDAKVKLLDVKGEMEGARQEKLEVYVDWL